MEGLEERKRKEKDNKIIWLDALRGATWVVELLHFYPRLWVERYDLSMFQERSRSRYSLLDNIVQI